MTNEQKLKEMGFADYSFIRSPIRIVVCDNAPYPSYFNKISSYTTSNNPVSSNTSSHGTNVCQVIKMCGDACGVDVELHYVNSLEQAVDVALELGIKVISRSVSIGYMRDTDQTTVKIKDFILKGGIWVNSAGNNVNGTNAPTDVPEQYGISVGCVFDSDNPNSFIVSHSSWVLPSLNGADNIFTHTSSATPCVAFGVAVIKELTGFNFQEMKDFIKSKAIKDSRLEEGEVLFQMPILTQYSTPVTNKDITIKLGDNKILVGDKTITMDTVAILDENDRILVPIRYIAYAFGRSPEDISYNAITKTATIKL